VKVTTVLLAFVLVSCGGSVSGSDSSDTGADAGIGEKAVNFTSCINPTPACEDGLTIWAPDCTPSSPPCAATGCLTAHKVGSGLNSLTANADECANFYALVQSKAFQSALRSTTSPCSGTGEVFKLILATGEEIDKDVAGCTDKPIQDVRDAVNTLKAELPVDAGAD
jgi:hypothetical protein